MALILSKAKGKIRIRNKILHLLKTGILFMIVSISKKNTP